MADKPNESLDDYDATQNLPPGEPTQVLPKGTQTGLPKRSQVMADLAKFFRKPAPKK